MIQYKLDFDKILWKTPMEGVRHKYFDQNGTRFRLVEYSKDMREHWCEKEHYGYLIDGEMEIEFDDRREGYSAGDGLILPSGSTYRHKARLISEKALVFFIEKS